MRYLICLRSIHISIWFVCFSDARGFNPCNPNLERFYRLSFHCFSCWPKPLSVTVSQLLSPAFCWLGGLCLLTITCLSCHPGSHHSAAMSSAHCIPSVHGTTFLKTDMPSNTEMPKLETICTLHWSSGSKRWYIPDFHVRSCWSTKVGFVPSTEMALKYY